MSETPRKKTISELFKEGTEIDLALKKGVRYALWVHKRLGNPIVIWRDGQVVWLRPEEIPVSDEKPETWWEALKKNP